MQTESYKKQYKERKERRDNGIVDGLPLKHIFPTFSKYYPAIAKGEYLLISTFSGVGKTQFTKFITVIAAWMYSKQNPNYKYKIFWFGFEETKEQFYDSFQLHVTYMKHQVRLDMFTLMNLQDDFPITEDMIKLFEDNELSIDDLLKNVEMFDQITNPYGIHLEIEKYAKENGTIEYEDILIDDKNEKTGEVKIDANGEPLKKTIRKPIRYISNNEEHVMLVFDHISLLTPEKQYGYDKRLTLENFSFEKCRLTYSKLFKYSVIAVQQQAQAEERMQYDVHGNPVLDKVKPSLSNLADSKATQRDVLSAITIFDPHRYHVKNYKNYNLQILGDNFREIEIAKNRYGSVAVTKGLIFDGATLRFSELPSSKEDSVLSDSQHVTIIDSWLKSVSVTEAANKLKNKN